MSGHHYRTFTGHPLLQETLERHEKLQERAAEFWKRFAPWFAGLKEHEQDFLLDLMKIISKEQPEGENTEN